MDYYGRQSTYFYEERMSAVRLLTEYDHQAARVIQKLGFPKRRTLREWYQEFLEAGDLHTAYPKRSPYSDTERQRAVQYFRTHGENIAGTVASLGYPRRDTLRRWIGEMTPGTRKASIRYGPSTSPSDEEKRVAVVELCAREQSAAAVADAFGVSRVSLYKWKTELLGACRKRRVKDPGRNVSSDDRDDLKHEVESLRKRVHRLQVERVVQAL